MATDSSTMDWKAILAAKRAKAHVAALSQLKPHKETIIEFILSHMEYEGMWITLTSDEDEYGGDINLLTIEDSDEGITDILRISIADGAAHTSLHLAQELINVIGKTWGLPLKNFQTVDPGDYHVMIDCAALRAV